MVTVSAPSLSTHGWIKDTAPLFTYLFSQFVLAQNSQTSTYIGQIASLSGVIQANQDDMSGCATSIEQILTRYLSRYFSEVIVAVTYNLVDPTTSSVKTNFTVQLNFTHNYVRHDASKILQRDGNIFTDISEVNNG